MHMLNAPHRTAILEVNLFISLLPTIHPVDIEIIEIVNTLDVSERFHPNSVSRGVTKIDQA